MANKKPLRIGLIGYGFMGRTHSNAFRKVSNFSILNTNHNSLLYVLEIKTVQKLLHLSGVMNPLKQIGVN